MNTRLFARLIGAIALFAVPLASADFVVNSTQDGADLNTGDDACNIQPAAFGDPVCTLRAAIEQANATAGTDIITFDVTGTISLNSPLPAISTAIDITGNSDITVDCNASAIAANTAFEYTNTATGVAYTLSDLTVTNCDDDTAPGGAAVRFVAPGAGSSLAISNVTFDSNTASAATGGAIRIGASNPNADQASLAVTVTNSTFTGNAATTGGGAIYNTATLVIEDSTFDQNTSGDNGPGGAIASVLGTAGGGLSVTDSSFTENVAGSDETGASNGGAIYALEGLSTLVSEITDSAFSGNIAVHGGGVTVGRGSVTIESSTFSANTVSGRGGAVYLAADGGVGSATIRNSTLSGNTAAAGGGIGAANGNNGGTLSMVNTTLALNDAHGIDLRPNQASFTDSPATNPFHKNLLADNTPANCAHTITHNDIINAGSQVSSDTSCGFTQNTDTESATVNLDVLADYAGDTQTHRLLAGSAAIDAGAPIGIATDQRGAPIADGDEDMTAVRDAGAYEFAGFSAVEFTAATFAEAEDNTPAMISARRYGNLTLGTSASVQSTGGSATDTDDYDTVNATVTWAAGNADDKTVEVTINDDNIVEGDETVELTITPTVPAGVDLGAANPATLTINDVEEGEFNLEATEYDVTEGTDAVLTITILRTGGSDGETVLQLATSDGGVPGSAGADDDSAEAGEDYTAVTEAVTFADGETSQDVEITITDDNLYEQDPESFTVTLTKTSGNGRLGDDTIANVRITSEDIAQTGTFSFTETTNNVSEDDGTLTLNVQRVGGDNCQVDLTYTVNNGTADAGTDFADTGDGTLSFAAGDSANKPITINLTADDERESTEDFTVVIATAEPQDCQPGATATIGDDDTATVNMTSPELEAFRFTVSDYTGSESSGSAIVTIEPLDAISGTDVTIEYATANGTAMAPADFTAATAQLTWADGESDARDVTIAIAADDEDEADPEETFTIGLTAITAGTTEIDDPDTATVTIEDLPGVRIVAGDYVADTESGSIQVMVERFGSFPAGGAQVEITAVESDPQSAESGVDFSATTRVITWAAADEPLTKTATFPILTDDLVEGDETFEVMLQNAVNLEIRDPSTETLTITDDDFGFVFSEATYDATETATTVTLTVQRVGVSVGAGSIDYATADGQGEDAAVAGEDYTAATGTLNWADGDTDPKTFTVTISNDDAVENVENFTATLSNGLPADSVDDAQTPSVAMVAIADNDTSISFTDPTYSANEDDGNATITLTRTGGLGVDATADVTLTAGTATADDDYVAETLTANWAVGEAAATVAVQLVADDEFEDDETVTLALTNPSTTGGGTVNIIDPASAELTIANDDDAIAGSVQFSAADYSALESDGTITITVTRTGGDDGAITVDYATADGSATAGSDYTAATGTLSWDDDNADPMTFTVDVINDAALEDSETVALSLSNPTGGATLGTPAGSTLTIADDDTALRLSADAYTAAEADGMVTITVERIGDTTAAASVDYATMDGSATAPANYTAATGTLNWAAGNADPMQFVVMLVDDNDANVDRDFRVRLSNPMPATGASVVAPQTATVTITDDEDKISFASATASVTEGAGQVVLSVVRSGSGNGAVSVTVSTANESATAPGDYTATNVTLSWADGETGAMAVNVPIIDDQSEEAAETFTANLSNATGGIPIGEIDTATVTISDNDQAGFVLAESGNGTSLSEGGAADTFTIALATQPTGTVTVTIAPPERVTADPETLTFTAANWDQPQEVSVQIGDDGVRQANRTASATITANSAADDNYDGLTETVTVTITDAGAVETLSGSSGSLGVPLLALLGLAAWRRRRRS